MFHTRLSQYADIVVYLMGIILFLWAFFGDPKKPFLFVVAILPFQNILRKIQALPMGKDLLDVLLFAIILGWFIKCKKESRRFIEKDPLNLIILFLMIYTFISLVLGAFYLNNQATMITRMQTWKNYMLLPIFYLITKNNIKDKKWIQLTTVVICVSIFVMGYNFFKNFKGKDVLDYSNTLRESGTFVYLGSNEYAAFFSQYMFILLGLFFSDKQILRKTLLGVTILFCIYCVLFLFSRGAYIGVAIGIVLISFLRKKIFLVPLLLLLISWNTLLPPSVVQRISMTKTETGELEHSAVLRIEMWEQCKELFAKNPVFGVGFNTIPYLGLVLGDSHNIYLKILVEQGVIGMIIFLILLWSAFKSGWSLYRTSNDQYLKGLGLGFMVCVVVLMILNFFGDRWTYLELSAYFWVFWGLVNSSRKISTEEIERKK